MHMTRSILVILGFVCGATVYGNCQSAVLTDYHTYTSGSYIAGVVPYGAAARHDIEGTNYTESLTYSSGESFPNNSRMTWQWPAIQSGQSAVGSYIQICYGDYDYTVPQTPITPEPVGNIATLTETHNFSLGGTLSGFDVIDDLFLTSQGTQGSEEGIQTHEIEIFLHSPSYAQAYVLDSGNAGPTVVRLGTFTVSGITWVVAEDMGTTPKDILFMPQNLQDIPNQTVDIRAMLQYLANKSAISSTEWFNGFAIGVEVQQGVGFAAFNSFAVSYQ